MSEPSELYALRVYIVRYEPDDPALPADNSEGYAGIAMSWRNALFSTNLEEAKVVLDECIAHIHSGTQCCLGSERIDEPGRLYDTVKWKLVPGSQYVKNKLMLIKSWIGEDGEWRTEEVYEKKIFE